MKAIVAAIESLRMASATNEEEEEEERETSKVARRSIYQTEN